MSAHVLLIFIKRVGGKGIKCKACQAFYLSRNELNNIINTRARKLDSIYHMILKLDLL